MGVEPTLGDEREELGGKRSGGRRDVAMQIAWGAIFLLSLLVFAVSVYQIFDDSRMPCTERGWDPSACVPFEEALFDLGLSPASFATYFIFLRVIAGLPLFITSILLVRRRPRSAYAIFFAVMLPVLAAAGTWLNPNWLWARDWLEEITSESFQVLIIGLLTMVFYGGGLFLFYTFPAGQLMPRITRWLIILWLPIAVAPSFFPESPLSFFNWPGPLSVLIPLAVLLSGLWAFVQRYRQASSDAQREQKWVIVTFLLLCAVFTVDFSVWNIIPTLADVTLIGIGMSSVVWELAQDSAWYVAQLAFGVAVGMAIFRYGWWANSSKGAEVEEA